MDPLTGYAATFAAKVVKELIESYVESTRSEIFSERTTKPGISESKFEKKIIRPAFGKYITRNTEFVESINDVRNLMETYIVRLSSNRPLNILLSAPPGSGKSFLIKQIKGSVTSTRNLVFEEVYVSALDKVSDLYGIFQRIQSINLEGDLPIVLFDEIDAKIDGGNLYAKFLAPMWDGSFYIGKERFSLGNCILFFAGSTLSLENESQAILDNHKNGEINYSEYYLQWVKKLEQFLKSDDKIKMKLPDFFDRIDYILRIPPIDPILLGDEYKSEYEDLACSLIRKHFGTVNLVEKRALLAITRLLALTQSRRPAEKAIFGSSLIDNTRFEFSCLPRRDRVSFERYEKDVMGEDIEAASTVGAIESKYYQIEFAKPSFENEDIK